MNSTFIQLPSINNGPNHLHGGSVGFDKRTWTVAQSTENSVTFTLHSPHLEEGYPGSLNVQAKWTLDTSKNDNSTCTILRLDLQAESADELESIVNLTNHTYFNLTGFKGMTPSTL